MSVNVRIRWDDGAFRRLLEEDTVPQAVWRAAGKVRDRAKMNVSRAGLVDTGALRNSIVGRRVHMGRGVWYPVGSPLDYAYFPHEGTRSPILPRRAKVLRFQSGGQYVFARRVSGVKATPFLTDALQTLSVSDFLS